MIAILLLLMNIFLIIPIFLNFFNIVNMNPDLI